MGLGKPPHKAVTWRSAHMLKAVGVHREAKRAPAVCMSLRKHKAMYTGRKHVKEPDEK